MRWLISLLFFLGHSCAQAAPTDVLLAEIADLNIDPSAYLVSEKLDGVRAIWDGQQLRFRSGQKINAPAWFVSKLPNTPLDGELWMGRSRFEELSGAVRRFPPIDAQWRQISYAIFELPGAPGSFAQRAQRISEIVHRTRFDALIAAEQREIHSNAELHVWLARVVASGGEGLMLHLKTAPYQTGRRDVLLKLKLKHDGDARVLRHLPGRGKYTNMMGALEVQSESGVVFRIGTGFNDADRQNPPPVGALISYRYRGFTRHGKPKFASYWRVRAAE
jgi:DNA ligase 1